MSRARRRPGLGHRMVMSVVAVAVVIGANAWVHDAADTADARATMMWPEARVVVTAAVDDDTSTATDRPVADGDLGQGVVGDPSTEAGVPVEVPTVDASDAGWEALTATLRASLSGNDAFAAAVVVDGEVVFETAAGERIPGEPAAPEHRFRLASLSKVVTAAVLMQLVQEGLIGLDEPVGRLLADHLGVEVIDDATTSVTVRRLLSHTAGFGKDWSLYFSGGLDKQWRNNAAAALRAGSSGSSGFSYSNTTYVLAGALIEAVAGRSYEDVVAERLLVPLGIEGPRLGVTQAVGPGEILHRSDPHRSYMEALGPAGGWVMSAAEIAVIVDSLRAVSASWQPLAFATANEMLGGLGRGALAQRSYGLGVMHFDDGSFGHTGTLQQTRSVVAARPDGVTWSVLVSGSRPDSSQRLHSIMARAVAAVSR